MTRNYANSQHTNMRMSTKYHADSQHNNCWFCFFSNFSDFSCLPYKGVSIVQVTVQILYVLMKYRRSLWVFNQKKKKMQPKGQEKEWKRTSHHDIPNYAHILLKKMFRIITTYNNIATKLYIFYKSVNHTAIISTCCA